MTKHIPQPPAHFFPFTVCHESTDATQHVVIFGIFFILPAALSVALSLAAAPGLMAEEALPASTSALAPAQDSTPHPAAIMDDQPATWSVFDHPATSQRHIMAFTQPAAELHLAAEFPGRVLSIMVREGKAVPEASDRWAQVVRLDSALLKKQRAQLEQQAAVAQAQANKPPRPSPKLSMKQRFSSQKLNDYSNSSRRSKLVNNSMTPRTILRHKHCSPAVLTTSSTSSPSPTNRNCSSDCLSSEQIDRHILRAPSGWMVREHLREPGSMVQPGEAIVSLVQMDALAIEIPLNTEELSAVAAQDDLSLALLDVRDDQGQPVQILATQHRVDPVADPVSRKRVLELRFPASDLDALDVKGIEGVEAAGGMRVQLTLTVPDRSGGFRIPTAYLGRRLEQFYVINAADNQELSVQVLRQDKSGAIISGTGLPAQVALRPIIIDEVIMTDAASADTDSQDEE